VWSDFEESMALIKHETASLKVDAKFIKHNKAVAWLISIIKRTPLYNSQLLLQNPLALVYEF